jgi:hypothetical protein
MSKIAFKGALVSQEVVLYNVFSLDLVIDFKKSNNFGIVIEVGSNVTKMFRTGFTTAA